MQEGSLDDDGLREFGHALETENLETIQEPSVSCEMHLQAKNRVLD